MTSTEWEVLFSGQQKREAFKTILSLTIDPLRAMGNT